ncbi:bacillithiol transferase BstA [soil metagenome]
MDEKLEDLRYPIGREEEDRYAEKEYDEELKNELLNHVKYLPAQIEYSIQTLDEHQLNTQYRPGGWTISQLVHHVADSHINAYVRFRLGLTENNPVIKPYDQDAWATLQDVATTPGNISITLLHSLHTRWYNLMISLTEQDWKKTIFHPERKATLTLWDMLKSYSWHGRHHLAHIINLKERMEWK